jgi:hypothetical protein
MNIGGYRIAGAFTHANDLTHQNIPIRFSTAYLLSTVDSRHSTKKKEKAMKPKKTKKKKRKKRRHL